jgi:hypothetical protein
MKKVLVLAIALTLALTVAAMAGQNPLNKIAVHVKAHPTSCTKAYPTFALCSSIVYTYAAGGDVDVMPVFFDLTNYTVVECGLIWPEGVWGSGSWVRCKGDVSVGSIAHSADQVAQDPATRGTAIAWSLCQTGFSNAPGYCWLAVTTAGRVCPAPDPPTGDMGVVDCNSIYEHPVQTYCAGIMGAAGDNPCLTSAVEQSTWGQIKSVFK